MKKILLTLAVLGCVSLWAQNTTKEKQDDAWKKEYRAFATKVNDLVHTKLDAKFDYDHSYLNGKVWITLHPHFYATDSLTLDAKGMNIYKVALVKAGKTIPLQYNYDSLFLRIHLDKTYKSGENYTIYIDYTAKPNEFKTEGSAAITDAKGLYFINPKGTDKEKPIQIWTQGETEANSVWVPTIDKPDQKTTQEFILTVPSKYVSLSNGKLVSQVKNTDGTRTDIWRMDLPHAPYLFFIGVGDYAVVKDSYKGKEVNYYVEKAYEKVARKIFGYTPEMIKFYSEKVTGIDFPWVKYSQIVGRDYVSGAMENTTATLHQESAQQDARELTDGNTWEEVIAHELFHQWFGDLVTCESWSNLTVNESFANYSELLWAEHKHGKDEADYVNMRDMTGYLQSGSANKDLVRFYYRDKEDMFDAVSYNKGGRILHMLRHYVGDDAFFASLHKYLIDNKFGNGNAHKLRLAFEAVTGKDLNWYFNQWYFGSGHPKLTINYAYDASTQTQKVFIEQTQGGNKIFKLPIDIDIYNGNNKKRYTVWMEDKADTFSFPVSAKPDNVNVDADKILLAEKKDNKTLDEYAFQFTHAGNYIDRREAIVFATANIKDATAYDIVAKALYDPYFRIRMKALETFSNHHDQLKDGTVKRIEELAHNDTYKLVRAAAIDVLAKLKNNAYRAFFLQATTDSSYSVAGAALEALSIIDSSAAITQANQLSKAPSKGRLNTAISNISIQYGDESAFDLVSSSFDKLPFGQEKFQQVPSFVQFLTKVTDLDKFKKGVDMIVSFREKIPDAYKQQTNPFINNFLTGLKAKKEAAGAKDFADYVQSKLPANK
ncbi:MAG: M1 family metallopeptidase [Bacteroidota bacterium]|nr:M1 family metallopeptidase [Bacteroidota bacterium]